MLRPEELTWTTRAEVCAQLAEFLLQTPPAPCAADAPEAEAEDTRGNAIALLSCLAGPTSIPALRRLLLDRHEARWQREHLVRALKRLKAVLPPEELKALLDDRALWDGLPRD